MKTVNHEPSREVVALIRTLVGRAEVVSYELRNKHVVAHLRNGCSFWVLEN